VLNAGTAVMGPFKDVTDKEVERTVNVNALQPIYLAKTMVPQLLERYEKTKVKSAIIVTSSGLGSRPISGTIAYSAAKSFSSFVAEAMNTEFKGKIDCMSYQAGEVATKLLGRQKTDMRTITVERAADTCFRDLGHMPMTRGSFRHEFAMIFMDHLPLIWIQNMMFGASKKALARTRKR